MAPAKKSGKSKSKAKTKKRDPAEIRRKLLDDPNTAKIAEKLQVPLEKYVAQVLYYAMNPKAEPTLLVVSDDNLRKMGYEPPNGDEMAKFINEAVAVNKAAVGSGYADPKKKLVSMDQGPGAKADPTQANPELDEEVTARRRGPSSKG